jgi:hypothetical protein
LILSDTEIREALREGFLVIDPPPPDEHFSSTALDLRIGDDIRRFNSNLFSAPGLKVLLEVQLGRFIDVGEETVERLTLCMNPVIDAGSAPHAVLILRHSDLHQHA